MARHNNTEIRSAIRDEQRVSVAIAKAGPANAGLKFLIHGEAGLSKAPNQSSQAQPVAPARPHLTRRELQILRFIAHGLHNRQIAARIHRSIKTVEKHRQNLHVKLSTHEVAGLTRQALAMDLVGRPERGMARLKKGAKQLTARELEILRMVAGGSGNKWIASELHRSIKTVDHHRENIMKKLDIHEVAGLTRHALLLGLL